MIIGGPGYKKGSETEEDTEPEGESSSSGEARLEAARALIRAVNGGKASEVDEALYAHHQACRSSPEPEDE